MPLDLVWMGEPPASVEAGPGVLDPWQPGMAFWAPYRHDLSRHYLEVVEAVRRPIMIMCPSRNSSHGAGFIIDAHPTGRPDGGWAVEVDLGSLVVGARPKITVSPSINLVGIWHGFCVDGILTDDLG